VAFSFMRNILKEPVLYINAAFTPYKMITAVEALMQLYTERVQVLHSDMSRVGFDDWCAYGHNLSPADYKFIKTPNRKIALPNTVISMSKDTTKTRKSKFSRRALMVRDGYCCGYCGAGLFPDEVHIDHIHPKSAGGKLSFVNTICACFSCNQRKANKTPEQSGMKLLWQPRIPHGHAFDVDYDALVKEFNPAWEQFLDRSKYDK